MSTRDCIVTAVWDRALLIIFCDLCIAEIGAGNRPNSYFSKVGWANLEAKFEELTGKNYNRDQLKNKWDGVKKDWKLWKELKKNSTGLGWDSRKKTIDASEDWWREKIASLPLAKKFKNAGIDPELEEKLDLMFQGAVAVGDNSLNPNIRGSNTVEPEPVIGDSLESSDNSEPTVNVPGESSRTKRPNLDSPKVQPRKRGGSSMAQSEFHNLITAVKGINSSTYSIPEVVGVLSAMPEMMANRPLYLNSLMLMEKPAIRDIIMSVDDKTRLDLLNAYFEKSR